MEVLGSLVGTPSSRVATFTTWMRSGGWCGRMRRSCWSSVLLKMLLGWSLRLDVRLLYVWLLRLCLRLEAGLFYMLLLWLSLHTGLLGRTLLLNGRPSE